MDSITCRVHKSLDEEPNPFNPPYHDVVVDSETGEKKFVASQPVKPSLAEDFDVLNNATYRGMQHGIQYRLNIDPVDAENELSKLV